MTVAFIHGFLLAVGLILPLGAQNMFVFTQGAIQRSRSGWLPVVVLAGLCDTLLITLAVGGVSVAVLSLTWLKTLLVGIGVLFLGYVGWLTWNSGAAVSGEMEESLEWPLRRKIVFTMSVSLLNPHAILDTVGVIGTSSLSYTGNERLVFALACILVSWLWFFMLANAGRLLRTLDGTGRVFAMFNRVSAVIMWVSGIYMVMNLFSS